MALTLPTNYANALSSPFKENILVRLYYDSSNYTAIALYDQTVSSVSYTGCILNNPAIRQSIDLKASTAKSANITLNCADATFGSDKLSALLIAGSNNYLNKKVELYSILNDSSSSSDQIKLYTGRLQSVSMDDSRVNINIVNHMPTDFINLPYSKSTNGVYTPIAYGDYVDNAAQSTENNKLYSAPRVIGSGFGAVYAVTDSISSGAGKAHYYDKNAKSFANLTLLDSSASTSVFGVQTVRVDADLTREHRLKPQHDSGGFTNSTNALDDDNTTFADSGTQTANNSEATQNYVVKLPSVSGKVTTFKLFVKATLTYTGSSSSLDFVNFRYATTYDSTTSSFANILNVNNPSTSADQTLSTSGATDITNSGTAHSEVDLVSVVNSNNNKLPDTITLQSRAYTTGTGNVVANVKLYDVWFKIITEEDIQNEPTAAKKAFEDLDKVYIGTDGLSKSWSSGAATKIHEFHRDILYRFLDVTTAPTNYSTLDSARSSWTGRFSNTEPRASKNILDQLQYEGGFIFTFNQDTPKYIFIPNSISADHANVTKSQINNLKISHTGIGDLITKMTINYEKNPAQNEYLQTTTYTSSDRGNYNFTTNESVAEVNLDALVGAVSGGSNRNDSFANYYDKITGTLKLLVSCDFVDPSLGAKVEVGDFVTFNNSNMATSPFGGAWTSKNFIVTSVNRKLGAQASVQLQEV